MQSVSSKIYKLWGSSFFSKCWKFYLNSENAKKSSEIIFGFFDNCIWECCYKLFVIRREYLLSAVNGLKNRPKILHILQRLSQPELPSQGSINMVKVLLSSFEQCFSQFRMLLVEGPLKRDFLDIYLTKFFRVRKSKNTYPMRIIFFWTCSKFYSNLENAKEIE